MALTQISTAGVKDDAVTAGKIPANAVGSSELADNAVDTAAVADDAVTYAKMQNTVEGARLLGRISAGGGQIQEQTAAEVRSFLNVADGATNSPTTTINNNADNRIVRGSNTANTLNAHTDVTINGSGHLNMGTPTSHYGISLAQGDYDVNKIGWADTGSTKRASIACKATGDVLSFMMGSSDSEKMRLDTDGRLMIGTDTEGHAAGDNLTVADTGHAGITIRSGTTSNGALYFSRGTSGGNEYRGAVVYHHDGNYLRFYTNGAEELRVHSGGGISFNGDTAAANALDDYEEGTWTPSMSEGSATFTGATYVKIGKLVHVSVYANSFSDNTSGSVIQFNGLPFTSASDQRSTGAMLLAYVTTLDQSVAYIGGNVSNIRLYHYDSGGDYTSLNYSAITAANNSTRRIFIGMTYMAA